MINISIANRTLWYYTCLVRLIAVTAIVGLFSCPGNAAEKKSVADLNAKRPIVLLFDTTKGEGADKEIAESTTRALRTYFRDTERVEACKFDRESPTVLRAIMEKNLTADQTASYANRVERLKVAQVLLFQYASGAEVSVKDDSVTLKLWLAKVGGTKKENWETTTTAQVVGGGGKDLDNAMQSAASMAVINVARSAFVEMPRIPEKEALNGTESVAIGADSVPVPKQPAASDLVAQADNNMNSGNTALAIAQYSQAVNADPSNPSLRLKLADAYVRRGLTKEAEDELNRAISVGADEKAVAAIRQKMVQPADTQQPAPPARVVITEPGKQVVSLSGPAAAKIIDGDKLWNDGKPDEAADVYREAIKLDPSDWRAYERLALVTASVSLFAESLKVIEQLQTVQPNPTADVIKNRYNMFRWAFDKHFGALLDQYDSEYESFSKGKLTHESYYSSVRGLAARLESMAKFMDAIRVPPEKQSANLHRSLASGLLAQAASNMLNYLESADEASKSNASIFAGQARKETETAAKLEAGN